MKTQEESDAIVQLTDNMLEMMQQQMVTTGLATAPPKPLEDVIDAQTKIAGSMRLLTDSRHRAKSGELPVEVQQREEGVCAEVWLCSERRSVI